MAYPTKSTILKTAVLLTVLSFSIAEARDAQVKGYVRKDGTYVQPHGRTSPNSSGFETTAPKVTGALTPGAVVA